MYWLPIWGYRRGDAPIGDGHGDAPISDVTAAGASLRRYQNMPCRPLSYSRQARQPHCQRVYWGKRCQTVFSIGHT